MHISLQKITRILAKRTENRRKKDRNYGIELQKWNTRLKDVKRSIGDRRQIT
jgi:hypothetical protein